MALLILTATSGPVMPPAGAVAQQGPTTWSPFGPRTQELEMTVYGDFPTMFDAFVDGKIDITDWPVNSFDILPFQNNPDFFVTDAQAGFGIFQLDINHHNSFLGVPMQEPRASDSFDSPSTKQPSQAGIHIRKALAHMLDKPSFITGFQLQGQADYADIQAPPAQGLIVDGVASSKLPQSILDEDCQDHPWFSLGNCHPVSAYNLVTDDLPDPFNSFPNKGWSGPTDLRAACDHLLLAGFTITPSTASCADVASGSGGAHLVPTGQVDLYIRSHPPRKAFGQIIKDAIDFLFGTPCTARYGTLCFQPYYFTLTEVVDIVFRTEPNRDDWHLYTGGWSLGSLPNHLFSLYHSSFASSACGGKKSSFAENYHFYCSPEFDQEAAAGQFAASLSDARLHFANAAVIGHRNVMTVPVYSPSGQRFAALNGWNFQPGTDSSLVAQVGSGFQRGFWSLLNMRQRPGYVPSDPRYVPGGGDPELIRRSLTHQVTRLSPFHALTVWDFEVLETVYDSMLRVNPLTGEGVQAVDWTTIKHSSMFDSVAGVTTQTWTLRNDLKWNDGVPVTADDVAYTIAAYRDVPSGVFQPSVFQVLTATAVDSRTVRVVLTGQSLFFELNIGELPIIPKHVWAPFCGDPPSSNSVCADPSFDPMATGIYVGSGPWVCRNLDTGAVGGSCTQQPGPGPVSALGGQRVDIGGKVVLSRYDGYMRAVVLESSLHKFSWADRNNDAKVDILDIADAAIHFGSPDAYWNTGQNILAPAVGTDNSRVDIGELATVASYFEHGLMKPFTPSQLVGLDPDIDPFF
ncbi:MAG TPA: ABC transporter substrate-binding protein [Candidatus Bathyarchaeia archaeon]